VTRAVLTEERGGVEAWIARHEGWSVAVDVDALTLEVRTTHPDGGPILILVSFEGYPAVPPTWRFVDAESREESPAAFPAAGPVNGQPSIFHGNRILCAQWSRLAYGEHGGPHGGWGPESGWRDVREGSHADNIAEMLAAMSVHLRASPGRMG
jgi:hypothetical protein